MHRLEGVIDALKGQLADASLYTTGEGARKAAMLKAELDQNEAALLSALERWEAATEASGSKA